MGPVPQAMFLKLCEGRGGVSPPDWVQISTPPTPTSSVLRKKHWSASWTVLEGGVLTFFKDSKTSAAGGLVRPVTEQGRPSALVFWSDLGKADVEDGFPSTKELDSDKERQCWQVHHSTKHSSRLGPAEQSLVIAPVWRAGRLGPGIPAHKMGLGSFLFSFLQAGRF